VVGSYLSVDSLADNFYVPLDALARETGTTGKGRMVMVLSEQDDVKSQRRLIGALTDALDAQHIEVSRSWSASAQWEETQASFGVLIYLLLTMAVLVATVGGIGLTSTMSINVVERRREIGVMRALGASSRAIVGIFVVEGMFVGALSWLLAVPLSIPSARLFSAVIGEAVVELPLEFAYSTDGMLLWLGIVATLSALSSLWPALKATQISVCEALAYE
jgi:putative ABC transport system permease protein